MVTMAVGVDDPANRLVADALDRCDQIGRRFGSHRIDDEHAVVADADRGVAARTDGRVDVALNGPQVDDAHTIASRSGGTVLSDEAPARRNHETPGDREEDFHRPPVPLCAGVAACAGIVAVGRVFIFSMYSGYMVSAPPRAGSSGILCLAAASLMNGLVPGR